MTAPAPAMGVVGSARRAWHRSSMSRSARRGASPERFSARRAPSCPGLAAAVDLLKAQSQNVGEYWSDYLKEIQAFKTGSSTSARPGRSSPTSPRPRRPPSRPCSPRRARPAGRTRGWSARRARHKTCGYKFIDHIVSPKINAAIAEWFGEAPANKKACAETVDPNHCTIFHAEDEEYFSKVAYWNTPITACLDGRTDVKCTDYATWTKAWTEIRNS